MNQSSVFGCDHCLLQPVSLLYCCVVYRKREARLIAVTDKRLVVSSQQWCSVRFTCKLQDSILVVDGQVVLKLCRYRVLLSHWYVPCGVEQRYVETQCVLLCSSSSAGPAYSPPNALTLWCTVTMLLPPAAELIVCGSAALQVQYSLLSAGPAQSAIKSVADNLGITLIAYSPLALGLLTGKYSDSNLPRGPRGSLFKQLLPGIAPVTSTLAAIASSRRKTMSQVGCVCCLIQCRRLLCSLLDLRVHLGSLPAVCDQLFASNRCIARAPYPSSGSACCLRSRGFCMRACTPPL